jgi:pSer/pThr/pTyr-binding forkhead associated (FHA) protein
LPAAVAPAAAAGDWVFTGGSRENRIGIRVSAEELRHSAGGSEGGIVLGRSRSLADRAVEDPSVSRRHAKLFLADGVLMVEDMGSAYGTRINGAALSAFAAAPLKAGDRLTLGGLALDVARG